MNHYGAFVASLAALPALPDARNLYAGDGAAAIMRRHNLVTYLCRMAGRRPRLLLVGEAPGHRGCGLTGIPFTSEAIMLAGSGPFEQLGTGFRITGDPNKPAREATATLVWAAIGEMAELPLLWNATPFHPHRPGDPQSNRPPRRSELAQGESVLRALLALFQIDQIIALGAKAAVTMNWMPAPAIRVRHPSHGGKRLFRAGLQAALASAPRAEKAAARTVG